MVRDQDLPRILVIDDLLGRTLPDRRNAERAQFCGALLLKDVTGDEEGFSGGQLIKSPIAEAFFLRGQKITRAGSQELVENDPEGTVRFVADGWNKDKSCWSLVLLDLSFATGNVAMKAEPPGVPVGQPSDKDPTTYFGLALFELLRSHFSDLPVLVLSANPREEVKLKLSQYGAAGFMDKGSIATADGLSKAIQKHGLLPDDCPEDDQSRIIGRSRVLLRALKTARLAAQSRKNILVRGENGTGKELLAAYIHRKSPGRRRHPFEVVNGARLTPELYQNELFGYKRGAFTGATEDHACLIKAQGGDVFLDEIAELHPEVQAGLLRLLESREYSPVGAPGERIELKDVRFLSATNADLQVRVGRGTFREDLYYRLREFGDEVYLPPLRERVADIPILAEHFVRRFESDFAARSRELTGEAMDLLCRYPWPGNIRELRNCLHAAVSRYDDADYLTPAHLPPLMPALTNQKTALELGTVREGMSFGLPGASLTELGGEFPPSSTKATRMLAEYLKAALDAYLSHTLASEDK